MHATSYALAAWLAATASNVIASTRMFMPSLGPSGRRASTVREQSCVRVLPAARLLGPYCQTNVQLERRMEFCTPQPSLHEARHGTPRTSCPPAAQTDPTVPNSMQPDITKAAASARESVQAPEILGLTDVFIDDCVFRSYPGAPIPAAPGHRFRNDAGAKSGTIRALIPV